MSFDLIVRGGMVYDGSGAPGRAADVGVKDGRIAAIGDLSGETATRIIEARGMAVAPGFIDIHSHSDLSLLVDPRAPSKVFQGITTEVNGNCGSSPAPLFGDEWDQYKEAARAEYDVDVTWHTMGEYLAALEARGQGINSAMLVGHGTIRGSVIGYEHRAAAPVELEQMGRMTAKALEDGAWGLSTGLIYIPSKYGDAAEITALAKVAADSGGIYTSHIRGEGDTLEAAVAEAIAIGEGSGAPVEISHHKASGKRNWGKVAGTLAAIEAARRRGVDVTTDQYPYIASSTGMATAVMPDWVVDGGTEPMLQRLSDPAQRARIVGEMNAMPDRDWSQVLVSAVLTEGNKQHQGRTAAEIGAVRGASPAEAMVDLVLEEQGRVDGVFFSMCEEDVERVMRDPYTSFGTDATARAPEGPLSRDNPHPRAYGTFPRILGEYVRERRVLPLAEAIRRMTGLPASRVGLSQRGIITKGFWADVVVFDPHAVRDRATFAAPHQYPDGIIAVLVNGTVAVAGGAHTGALAGKVLRRGAD